MFGQSADSELAVRNMTRATTIATANFSNKFNLALLRKFNSKQACNFVISLSPTDGIITAY